MPEQCRWRTTFPDKVSIDITRISGENFDGNQIEYTLEVSAGNAVIDDQDLVIDGEGEITVTPARIESNREVAVTVPDESGIIRIHVCCGGQQYPIYLPGPSFLENCSDAIQGDSDAAKNVIAEFDAPPQIPAICGEFLTISEVGELVKTLTQVSGYMESYLHSYRYDLIRGAITTSSGLSVQSANELESLIDSLDEVENIGPVNLVDVLSDPMATVLTSATETKELLDSLGYDLATVERFDDDLFFACYLAQLVLSDGLRAAEGHAMRRRWYLDGNYKRRKTQAKNADYHDRGRAWRELLCPAARQSVNEFAYALANALYWSGETSRTDSRMDELLLEAATAVASEIGVEQIEGRARYEHCLSRGHRLRSQNCYSLATVTFDRAADVASEYDFLPEWEPVYVKATVHAAEQRIAGNHKRAIKILDDALERLFEFDVPSEKLNHIIHHIEGQKLERKAKLADFQDDSDDPGSLLREARTHYDVIGLARSRARTNQKLQRAKQKAPGAESESAATTETAQQAAGGNQTPAEESSSSVEATEGTPQQEQRTGRHVRSDHAREEFEPNPELDDFLTPTDPDEVGSADLMTSPDNRDDDPDVGTGSGWMTEDHPDRER